MIKSVVAALLAFAPVSAQAQAWSEIQDCVAQCSRGEEQAAVRCQQQCESEWREEMRQNCDPNETYQRGDPCY